MEEGERVIETEASRTAAMEEAIAHVRATEPPHRAERWAEMLHVLGHGQPSTDCPVCEAEAALPPNIAGRIPEWARFIRVDRDGCWRWTGGHNDHGYGRCHYPDGRRPRSGYAHRAIYERLVGPIPEGLQLDHLCRHPSCVRPSHLEPVTAGENWRRTPLYLRPTCRHGHPRSAANTYLTPQGYRKCRPCHVLEERRRKERQQETAHRLAHTPYVSGCERCDEWREEAAAAGLPE